MNENLSYSALHKSIRTGASKVWDRRAAASTVSNLYLKCRSLRYRISEMRSEIAILTLLMKFPLSLIKMSENASNTAAGTRSILQRLVVAH